MKDLYVYPNKKVVVLVIIKKYHGGTKSYKIVDAVVKSVGTKYVYLKYDQLNLGSFKGRPKFDKKTGLQTDRHERYTRIIFNDNEEAEKYIANNHNLRLRNALNQELHYGKNTNEKLLKALEALGGKDPGAL
jgi:hypothetical protein